MEKLVGTGSGPQPSQSPTAPKQLLLISVGAAEGDQSCKLLLLAGGANVASPDAFMAAYGELPPACSDDGLQDSQNNGPQHSSSTDIGDAPEVLQFGTAVAAATGEVSQPAGPAATLALALALALVQPALEAETDPGPRFPLLDEGERLAVLCAESQLL